MTALRTPVAVVIFNRPEATRTLLATLAEVRPPKILVIADGPRPDREGEKAQCELARALLHRPTWPCEVEWNISDVNLGCRTRVSTGLDWAFSRSERLIVLEDDVVPSPSFFPFAESMLDKYEAEDQVFGVSGANPLGAWKSKRQSYHFSAFGHVWGWASWRRAWNQYSVDFRDWDDVKTRARVKASLAAVDAEHRWRLYERTKCGDINTWDYQWEYTALSRGALFVMPSVNLIRNIGFGSDATHTVAAEGPEWSRQTGCLLPPYLEPTRIEEDREFDRRYLRRPGLWERALGRVRRNLRSARR